MPNVFVIVPCVVLIVVLIAVILLLNRPQDKDKEKIIEPKVIVEAPPVVADEVIEEPQPVTAMRELTSPTGTLRGVTRTPTGRLPAMEIEVLPVPTSGYFSYLVFRSGARAGESFSLDRCKNGSCVVGRSDLPENQLILREDTKVSRVRHAEITRDSQGVYAITDNDSVNGVWINEKRISAQIKTELRSGDKIRLGVTELEYVSQTA